MPLTNKWLCVYAIAQLGRPYWYATRGQIATNDVYASYVAPNTYYADYTADLGQKVHDCSGLVLGALMCDSVDGEPTGSEPIAHGATSQFNYNCSEKSNTMSDFPYIPGTLVFTSQGDIKRHVGIYVGDFIDKDGDKHTNAVVEAMGHDYGVVTSDIDSYRWDSWGQLECCTVDTARGMTIDVRTAGVYGNAVQIDATQFNPFVAALSPAYKNTLDYDKIRDARISAMMFFGGELFDMGHNTQTYINKNLGALVQQCNDAGMPYGIYVHVKAKNEIEADAECRALYYVLSHYPPKLGVWLSLQTHNFTETNDKILEVYYRYIEKWGFKNKCGLYLTEDMLNKITWTSFQERFYLWLIKSMPVTEVDDELLQPEMFEVPE